MHVVGGFRLLAPTSPKLNNTRTFMLKGKKT